MQKQRFPGEETKNQLDMAPLADLELPQFKKLKDPAAYKAQEKKQRMGGRHCVICGEPESSCSIGPYK